jgi:predicted nucleotide-binding protein
MGKLGRDRVCCLYKKGVEIPSDVLGILYLEFNTRAEDRYRHIIQELRVAGYDIKI